MEQVNIREAWPQSTLRLMEELNNTGIEHGWFCTGIENSDPFVDGVRRNQLREAHDFYRNWEERLERIRSLGITWLRFGEGYSSVHLGPGCFNFDLTDKVLGKCNDLGITVIADLLHFGLPEWIHAENPDQPFFQNPRFPEVFAEYVRAFVRRYPFIRYYTPVNEPSVAAALSAYSGLWNEQLSSHGGDDRYYVRAIANIARATILARDVINHERGGQMPAPVFVLNESIEKFVAVDGSERGREAEHLNLGHLASLDLIFGRHCQESRNYLLGQGLSESEYEWFMEHGTKERFILGIDYYLWCVKKVYRDRISPDLPLIPKQFVDVEYELYEMAAHRCERYGYIPILHTEFNAWSENAVTMCHQTYDALTRLRRDGYPVLGMSWYGDELQIGWHWILSGPDAYEETPVGLFYKGCKQPVADVFADCAARGFPAFPE